MSDFERIIFVVVDPAQDKALALNRILNTAKISVVRANNKPPKLHVFLAVDYDHTDTSAENPAIHRSGDWFFEQVLNPLQDSGLQFQIEMSWSSDWYGAILAAAEKIKPEMIMLPLLTRPSAHERIFNESIWRLMRTAKSPVLMVQPGSPEERNVVLSALNIQSHKAKYQELNDMIISRGSWVAEVNNAEHHIVNAYKDSLNYPDRSELAKRTQVDTARIHVKGGDADDVISEVAKTINADLVVIGTRARSSRWRGNTSEKIITRVKCDVLAIN